MKRNKMVIIILVISLIAIIAAVSLIVYERNNATKIRKVWNLATNNALFLYQQYEDENVTEAYSLALGEMGTIVNTISYLNYGGKSKLTEAQLAELSSFYLNLEGKQEFMKLHIPKIIEIVKLLQCEDDDAFMKMKVLRDSIE